MAPFARHTKKTTGQTTPRADGTSVRTSDGQGWFRCPRPVLLPGPAPRRVCAWTDSLVGVDSGSFQCYDGCERTPAPAIISSPDKAGTKPVVFAIAAIIACILTGVFFVSSDPHPIIDHGPSASGSKCPRAPTKYASESVLR
jgi:hypothetical protein